MTVLIPEFEHKDKRRQLIQLLTADIKQINLYEAKKGAILGNHFHKETTEYFLILKGYIWYNQTEYFYKGMMFKVEPPEEHNIECMSDVTLMTFLTKPFTKENPDLWKK